MLWSFLFFTGVGLGDSISTSLLTRWPLADLKSKYKISLEACIRTLKTTSKEDGEEKAWMFGGGGGRDKEEFGGWEVEWTT